MTDTITIQANPETGALGLRWTHHPIMDMAIAGLTVFAKKDRPEDVTASDIEVFKKWALQYYFTPELTSWIAVVFTSNFLNPTFSPEKKKAVLAEVIGAYQRPNGLTTPCAFFPELPAQKRVSRELFPMLMGRGPMNFFPDGQPGVPLSGLAITALQGLSVAAPLVSGKVMVVAADDERALMALVTRWQRKLKERANDSYLLSEKGQGWTSPKTRVIEGLREPLRALADAPVSKGGQFDRLRGGLTVYHLSNSGQGPDVQIFPLSHPALTFLQQAEQHHSGVWSALVARSTWAARKGKDSADGQSVGIYEALFLLPEGAAQFLARHLKPPFDAALRPRGSVAELAETAKKVKAAAPSPPRPPIQLDQLWAFTKTFLKEIVAMDKARIEALSTVGDELAAWIADEEDMGLFRKVYEARRPATLRAVLLSASLERAKRNLPPFLTLERYQDMFMEGEERARADFYLSRDLLKMRLIERLHADERKPLVKNKTELEDVDVPTPDLTETTEGDE